MEYMNFLARFFLICSRKFCSNQIFEIKNHFGMSYKDIEDDKIPELEKFIEFIQNNPR